MRIEREKTIRREYVGEKVKKIVGQIVRSVTGVTEEGVKGVNKNYRNIHIHELLVQYFFELQAEASCPLFRSSSAMFLFVRVDAAIFLFLFLILFHIFLFDLH
jgi:hypothetical protein